jgi:hypothetical protein
MDKTNVQGASYANAFKDADDGAIRSASSYDWIEGAQNSHALQLNVEHPLAGRNIA